MREHTGCFRTLFSLEYSLALSAGKRAILYAGAGAALCKVALWATLAEQGRQPAARAAAPRRRVTPTGYELPQPPTLAMVLHYVLLSVMLAALGAAHRTETQATRTQFSQQGRGQRSRELARRRKKKQFCYIYNFSSNPPLSAPATKVSSAGARSTPCL